MAHCTFLSILSIIGLFACVLSDPVAVIPIDERRLSNNGSDHHRRSKSSVNFWKLLQNSVNYEFLNMFAQNHSDYKKRQPFPHALLENIFPAGLLRAVAHEIPDDPVQNDGCIQGSDKCFKKGSNERNKNAFENDFFHGPATAILFAFLKSSSFIRFLEQLTGIDDLIPDPHYRGSGIHQTLTGGFLNIHADFNRYERYGLHRRVNILLYLNPDWEEAWGGHLELWSKDMKKCMIRVKPDIGKLVVFSSTDFSYHGHPKPVLCPKNRSRRSLALYYYTRTRPSNECLNDNCNSAHSTLFQKPLCEDCALEKCQRFAYPHS